MLEGEAVGRPVALHHHAFQPQQRGTVVTAWIEPALESAQRRHGQQAGNTGQPVASELGAERGGNHLGESFGGFQGHVADKAVAHDHVGGALENVVTFNVAVKIQVAVAQQFCSPLHHVIALDGFLADIEQAHARIRLVLHRRYQHGPHDAELQQMFGRAIDIGAHVEHQRVAHARRHHAGNGWTVDARQGFQDEAGRRHQRASITRRHAGIGLARLDEIDGHAHRGILLAAQGQRWRLVHGHHLAGVTHDQAWADPGPARLELRRNDVLRPDQDHIQVGMTRKATDRRGNRDMGAVVAPHDINGDSDISHAAGIVG